MVKLSEMVGKAQLEAVISDVYNGAALKNEDTYTPANDKIRTDIAAMKKKVKALPANSLQIE